MTGNKQLIWDKNRFFIISKTARTGFIIRTGSEDNSIVINLGLFIDKFWLIIVMENLKTYLHKIVNISWVLFIFVFKFCLNGLFLSKDFDFKDCNFLLISWLLE